MITDFLKKYQKELITNRIQLKEDMDFLETKIKEESKFLSLLEESNDSYFKEFTPRDINSKNNEKAAEVRILLDDLQKQMDSLTSQMKFYDARLIEVGDLISDNINKNTNNNIDLTETTSLKYDDIKDKLNSVRNLIVLDPFRAQQEIDKIISSI